MTHAETIEAALSWVESGQHPNPNAEVLAAEVRRCHAEIERLKMLASHVTRNPQEDAFYRRVEP